MGGPPDAGGAKNAIQARASTKTYLERYTLKAITGLSEQDDDTDGNAARDEELRDSWISKIAQAETLEQAVKTWEDGCEAIQKTNNLAAFEAFKKAYADKRAMLKQGDAR